jgi:hypothetical protein
MLLPADNCTQAPWAFDRMDACAIKMFNQSVNQCWCACSDLGVDVFVGDNTEAAVGRAAEEEGQSHR